MKKPVPMESASAFIDERIKELGDWRGKILERVRGIIDEADPEIIEEWNWVKPTSPGTPVWSYSGIVCTGETYKNMVKMTFAKGSALEDLSGLFSPSPRLLRERKKAPNHQEKLRTNSNMKPVYSTSR
jgi:hypothetical protein